MVLKIAMASIFKNRRLEIEFLTSLSIILFLLAYKKELCIDLKKKDGQDARRISRNFTPYQET